MRKWIAATASAFGTAIAAKIVDHIFPAVFPKLISWLSLAVPAWLLVVALAVGAILAWLLGRASVGSQKSGQVEVELGDSPSFQPGEHEEIILKLFGRAGGAGRKMHLDQHLPSAAASSGLTVVELNHAVEALREWGWLEDTYEPPLHDLGFRLSPSAARYCRANGWMKAAEAPTKA